MRELTFDILKIIAAICAALVTAYVIPYLKTLKEDKRYDALIEIVTVAVRAAEQVLKHESGAVKKAEVVKFVREWLDRKGIRITDEELDQLLEAAVYGMKQEALHGN